MQYPAQTAIELHIQTVIQEALGAESEFTPEGEKFSSPELIKIRIRQYAFVQNVAIVQMKCEGLDVKKI
jgi:hypothetical protein